MDQDSELRKAKWILAAGFVFLVSCFYAYGELAYLIWGRSAEARLTEPPKIVVMKSRRGGETEQLRVEYRFADGDSDLRTEVDMVPTDWPVPREGTVAIQYIPGDKYSSRLVGHRQTVWLVIFFLSLAATAFFVYRLAKEANEPIGKRRKPSRSR